MEHEVILGFNESRSIRNNTLIRIKKYDGLTLQVVTDDRGYITCLADHLTDYVENFRHMQKYKSGMWDGRISMFAKSNRTFPYGLIFDVIRFHRTQYKDVELCIDDDVKEMFKGIDDVEADYDLNIFPRDYQIDCIEKCLKYKSGIIVSCTASGKSCIISYIMKYLMDNSLIRKTLIIVPTISLVQQFYSDMIEYGIDKDLIGRVYSKLKEFDKKVVISTWQTLIKNFDRLNEFDCVMCDEVHTSQSYSVRTILNKCINASWRFGFTGTLPTSKIDVWNIKSYLGPILCTYGAAELAELGYVSKCNIECVNINYNAPEKYAGDYNEVKEMVFNNEARLHYIKDTLAKLDGNALVLVGLIEKEGQVLKDYLDKSNIDKEIVFIWGETKVEEREFWRNELGKRNNIILIATYQIFQVGVNVPSLKYIMFASPFKSKIRVLQSIGRALRKHDSKDHAVIYDIIDNVKFLEEHGTKRMRYYSQEKFNINEITLDENRLLLF